MACSAGLWLASATDKIIASTENDEIGSVGVQFSFADLQPMWEKEGIKFHTVTAKQSQDKNKAFFDMLKGDYKAIKEEKGPIETLENEVEHFIDKQVDKTVEDLKIEKKKVIVGGVEIPEN